jgi:hypothetical protein
VAALSKKQFNKELTDVKNTSQNHHPCIFGCCFVYFDDSFHFSSINGLWKGEDEQYV